MRGRPRRMSYRDFDVYRLVVVRRFKQLDVARSFGVTRSRIAQIRSRVENWVNERVGAWLFPSRPDLRFYVALDREEIRVREGTDPEDVLITHLSGVPSYSRTGPTPSEMTEVVVHESAQPATFRKPKSSPNVAAHNDANFSAKPLNFSSSPPSATDVATLSAPIGFAPIATTMNAT